MSRKNKISFCCEDNLLKSLEYGPFIVDKAYIVDNEFEIERHFIKSGKCTSTKPKLYWPQLLQWTIKEHIDLNEVKGWPKNFLIDNIIKSAKSISKFSL